MQLDKKTKISRKNWSQGLTIFGNKKYYSEVCLKAPKFLDINKNNIFLNLIEFLIEFDEFKFLGSSVEESKREIKNMKGLDCPLSEYETILRAKGKIEIESEDNQEDGNEKEFIYEDFYFLIKSSFNRFETDGIIYSTKVGSSTNVLSKEKKTTCFSVLSEHNLLIEQFDINFEFFSKSYLGSMIGNTVKLESYVHVNSKDDEITIETMNSNSKLLTNQKLKNVIYAINTSLTENFGEFLQILET